MCFFRGVSGGGGGGAGGAGGRGAGAIKLRITEMGSNAIAATLTAKFQEAIKSLIVTKPLSWVIEEPPVARVDNGIGDVLVREK